MRRVFRWVRLWVLLAGGLLGGMWVSGAPGQARAAAPEPLRVLFVGNSYTRFNVLPRVVQRIARAEAVDMRVQVVAKGGLTLRMHWRRREALEQIRSGRFSHVVLQGHSLEPVDRVGEFDAYSDRFSRSVGQSGAQLVLYQTWARRPGDRLYRTHPSLTSEPQMSREVGAAYARAAVQLDASLAPVGAAFSQALLQSPDIELYRADGTHPSWAGTYLAALVLYAALTGAEPQSLRYAPWEVPAATAARLRDVAALAVDQRPALRASSQRWVSGETGAP